MGGSLQIYGFISKHPDWSLKTGKIGKQILYRLSDNYLRFYIHYIEPNLTKIEQGSFFNVPLSIPKQVEELVFRQCQRPGVHIS